MTAKLTDVKLKNEKLTINRRQTEKIGQNDDHLKNGQTARSTVQMDKLMDQLRN